MDQQGRVALSISARIYIFLASPRLLQLVLPMDSTLECRNNFPIRCASRPNLSNRRLENPLLHVCELKPGPSCWSCLLSSSTQEWRNADTHGLALDIGLESSPMFASVAY